MAGAGAALDAVVFDLDGVLVDSRRPIAACLNAALADHGLAPEPEDRLHRFIGPPLRDAFLALLAARGAEASAVDACIARYRHHYREASLALTVPFPGVPELLDALAADGLRLAVATSKPEAFARPILERLALAPRFDVIVGPPLERTHEEDKTGTLGRALRALAAPGRTAMVGDRHVDVRAGLHHGCLTVGAVWGIGGADELRAAGAHLLAASPSALAALLRRAPSAAPRREGAEGA
ncbi:MAG: HAD hydrolase-like protein [Myxococcota bacterium]|nr:HAD hydrolase-like protein [Myxococcota bacterium]